LLMTDLEILYKTMAKINKLRWSPALGVFRLPFPGRGPYPAGWPGSLRHISPVSRLRLALSSNFTPTARRAMLAFGVLCDEIYLYIQSVICVTANRPTRNKKQQQILLTNLCCFFAWRCCIPQQVLLEYASLRVTLYLFRIGASIDGAGNSKI
ncbi:MAG: hypothetical protein BECKG1743D_GA0114223_108581, partial [Candidatus Kentron sp. G]